MLFSTARQHCHSAKSALNLALNATNGLKPEHSWTPHQSKAIDRAFRNLCTAQENLKNYIGNNLLKRLVCFLFGGQIKSKLTKLMKDMAPLQKEIKGNAALSGAIARRKIQKAIASAEADFEKPLTEDEYRFIAARSFGLRCAPKGEREFIDGIAKGDAISLSGRPRAWSGVDQVLFPKEREDFELQADLMHEISAYELQVQQFITHSFWIASQLRNIPLDSSTDHIRKHISERKMHVRFLLGNFQGADFPYDVRNYFQLGKCGSHQYFKTPREKGKAIKLFKIEPKLWELCEQIPVSSEEQWGEQRDEILKQIASSLWKQVRFELRKHYLLQDL